MPLDQGSTQVLSALSGNAVMIWMREDGSEVQFPIIAPVTTFGREPSNMIPLNDATVSRFHAKLVYQNGQYVLMDLGSANKTFVNGQEIKEAVLHSGCDIKFAGLRFKFQELRPSAPAYAPPAAAYPSPTPAPSGPRVSPSPSYPPYPPAAAPAAPAQVKGKPKPLIIVGGVFAVLLILVVTFSLMTKSSKPTTPSAQGAKTPVTEPASPALPSSRSSAPVTAPPSGATPATATTPTAPATQPTIPTSAPTSTPSAGAAATSSASPPATMPALPPPSGPPSISRMLDEAAVLQTSGKLRDAKMKYEQVLKLDPTNSRARSHVESLRATIKDAVELHFKNAKQAYDFLRYDEAVDEWNLVLSLADPTDPRYLDSQRGIQQAQARLKR
jgi:predicted component of type VI protein secretion system